MLPSLRLALMAVAVAMVPAALVAQTPASAGPAPTMASTIAPWWEMIEKILHHGG